MKQLLLLVFAVSVFFFFRNMVYLMFGIGNIKTYKKRLKQLKFETKSDQGQMEEFIDTVTKPIISVVFPKLNMFDFERTEKELRHAKWKIDAKQFVALKLLAKAASILFVFLFASIDALIVGIVWGGLLFFAPQFLMSNSAKNRREAIMLQFPDFIRIVQGYLTADMPFEKAIMEAAPFLNEDWQEILGKFKSKAESNKMEAALDFLKDEIGTMEVREFISLVKLTLEQGGKEKDSFEAQAEKIQLMLYDMMVIKINRRKIYGILIQAPLLLCNMAVIGLPVVDSFINLGI